MHIGKGKVQRPFYMVQVLVELFLGAKASNDALFVGAVVQIGPTVLGIDFSLRHGVLWVDWTPWHTCLPCTRHFLLYFVHAQRFVCGFLVRTVTMLTMGRRHLSATTQQKMQESR